MTTETEIYLGAKDFEKKVAIKLDEIELYKDSWVHYSPEIVSIIEGLKEEGIFPYNRVVAEHCQFLKIKEDLLDRIVYNSQSYLHDKENFDLVEGFKEKYSDWKEVIKEDIEEVIKSKKFVMVVGLLNEPFKARPWYDYEGNLWWIKPRFKVKGIRLTTVRYKEI